jgi:hypothetical protein
MKRGRPSVAEQEVIPLFPRSKKLQPPPELSAKEAALFRDIVSNSPSGQFVSNDVGLLATYCQSTVAAREAAKNLDDPDALKVWDRACKIQCMTATKLRLTPSSRLNPTTLARKIAAHRPSFYDQMEQDDDN